MTARTSNWIPSRRIRFVAGLALAFAAAAAVGSRWSLLALLLLVPALGAGWAAFVMLRIRRQLSPGRGGGWERRIHELVVSRLGLAPDSRAAALDIGCGDASLLVALLDHAPAVAATGVDYWSGSWDYAQAACEARLSRLGLKAAFQRMDAARLVFPDASFDAVVSVMCFHEVKAPRGVKMRGPLLAVSEALRVLRPGGAFVFVDRFGDAADYGEPAGLAAVLPVAGVRRESLVATLGVPWPLNTRRSLGPVEVISGRKSPMG
ncbi:SAM-dependent methyltransferase [Caulobacter ginsengisoli]|uniref:SAM-dependent methyltransferase n=1 Tax=Caulobacter ginsengisoli TaxID=400775 RepID=A0ABU0IUC9_9CAUL|nr:class I SAM-dependent methyltransferase [Caulobacter ginsengisoli]MDQ0465015.1 SAM-dependent methyltransferase [Caulobacter ginsengisoli]